MQLIGRHFASGQAIRLSISGNQISEVLPVAADSALPWIAPGLVDLQVNGYGGVEFCSPGLTVAMVQQVCREMAAMGVTQFCPTVTTSSLAVLKSSLRTLAEAIAGDPIVALLVAGIHLEGPYLSRENGPRGAHPSEHCHAPNWDEFCELQQAAQGRIRLVTLSPEYDSAPEVIRQMRTSGVVVSLGHLSANSEQIAAAVEAGAQLSTHLGNGCHLNVPRHPNYLWDQLAEPRLSASLIVDGHHLPRNFVRAVVNAKTRARIILVSDLSGKAGLPPGQYPGDLTDLEILPSGQIVVAGQRQLMAGASAPLGAGLATYLKFTGDSLAEAIPLVTTQPARLIGARVGSLEVGATADLVCFQLSADGTWQTVQSVAEGIEIHSQKGNPAPRRP